MDVIIIEIGARRCAVDLAAVEEVIPLGPITPVHSAPAMVVGAMNVRGQVCPVLHLERVEGLECAAPRLPRRGQAGLLICADGYHAVLYARRIGEVVRAQSGPATGAAAGPVSARLATELGEMDLLDLDRVLNDCAAQMNAAADARA